MAFVPPTTAVVEAATRVALVSTCGGSAGVDVLALAEAKLSAQPDIALVERAMVERVLDEQKLTRCGLSDSAQALAVGRLLGVQVFATLETFPGSQEALGMVVFDARSGAKLWDATMPAGNAQNAADGIVAAVHEACEKRLRPASTLRTVCVLSIRNAELPRAMDSFCESVGQLLERGMLGSTSLAVLERERLEQINRERSLPTNDLANDLLPSLTLLELEFSRGGESNGVKATVFLTDASGASLGKVQASGRTEQVTDLVELLLQQLTQSLNAAPTFRTVDRPREAQRFRQEARFFIEHNLFAKSLQAAEAAYALNPADKELRGLLAHALFGAASDLLSSANLERAFSLADRGAELCLQLRAEAVAAGVFRYVPLPPQEGAFGSFLAKARLAAETYDDQVRGLFAKLQAKYHRMLVEVWERPTLAAIANPAGFDGSIYHFYWFIYGLDTGSATSEAWTTDVADTLNYLLGLLDKFGTCRVNEEGVNAIFSSMFCRIKEPDKTTDNPRGLRWSLDETDKLRLEAVFGVLRRHQDPLLRLYGMTSELAATLRKEPRQTELTAARLEEIKRLAEETLSSPPCQRPDNYRIAVYQILLDTIDLLPDPVMRRKEYQNLFNFMVERREYFHWVAMAAIDPQTYTFAAYRYMASVFPGEQKSPGDPALCAQNLELLQALLNSPDCHKLVSPIHGWDAELDAQLEKIKQSIAGQQPGLMPATPAPWSAARLLYDGPSTLLQARVAGNSIWGLELTQGEKPAPRASCASRSMAVRCGDTTEFPPTVRPTDSTPRSSVMGSWFFLRMPPL